jgi:hypothetical protein
MKLEGKSELFRMLAPAHEDMGTVAGLLRLTEERLATLESAAWDVFDVVRDALDTPEDADMKRIQAALDVMGELIPAARPPVRGDAALLQWFCGPCNCWHSPPMHTVRETDAHG